MVLDFPDCPWLEAVSGRSTVKLSSLTAGYRLRAELVTLVVVGFGSLEITFFFVVLFYSSLDSVSEFDRELELLSSRFRRFDGRFERGFRDSWISL